VSGTKRHPCLRSGTPLANDTEFGLAAYFYTGDLGRAFRVMEGLKYRRQ
jgi:acyl-CoA reductase-like NAD-dependent aldehyde dehydrogenase